MRSPVAPIIRQSMYSGGCCRMLFIHCFIAISHLTHFECRMTSKGAEYRGRQSHTASYRACQRWNTQSPHGHSFRYGWMFADGNVTAAGAYCRNPGGVRERPWCWTTDPAVAWEYCRVPLCGCRATRSGVDYQGAISRTISGRTCQRWDSQQPHSHGYYTTINPSLDPSQGANGREGDTRQEESLLSAENYCRNPDPWDSTGPWCYTIDPSVRWEYCNVPFCECKYSTTGVEYAGRISQTRSGLDCQRWSAQQPQQHHYHRDSDFPDETAEDAVNYCRNPDPQQRTDGPWCLTTNPNVAWDYCSIPLCSDDEVDQPEIDDVVIASHFDRQPSLKPTTMARGFLFGSMPSTTTTYSNGANVLCFVCLVYNHSSFNWSTTSLYAGLSASCFILLLATVAVVTLVAKKRLRTTSAASSRLGKNTGATPATVAITDVVLTNESGSSYVGSLSSRGGATVDRLLWCRGDDTTTCLLNEPRSKTRTDKNTSGSRSTTNDIQFFLKVVSSSSQETAALDSASTSVSAADFSCSGRNQLPGSQLIKEMNSSDDRSGDRHTNLATCLRTNLPHKPSTTSHLSDGTDFGECDKQQPKCSCSLFKSRRRWSSRLSYDTEVERFAVTGTALRFSTLPLPLSSHCCRTAEFAADVNVKPEVAAAADSELDCVIRTQQRSQCNCACVQENVSCTGRCHDGHVTVRNSPVDLCRYYHAEARCGHSGPDVHRGIEVNPYVYWNSRHVALR